MCGKERKTMARKRLIDTEEFYFDTELVNLLGARGLHLYIRLWGLAEDWGGYEPKYEDIALKMGALRFKGREIKNYIEKLIEKKKIIEYKTNNKTIHWIVNLLKHQPLDNPTLPKLPLPRWISCETKQYKTSKRVFAHYTIIREKLPADYLSATCRLPVGEQKLSNVTKRNVMKRNVMKRKEKFIAEIFSYFLLKTNQKLQLTPERKTIIEKQYEDGKTLEDLKKAIDNFIQDPWEDRPKYMDLVYCLGVRNKISNFEKWFNWKPQFKGGYDKETFEKLRKGGIKVE
jgi:hypothetical protein